MAKWSMVVALGLALALVAGNVDATQAMERRAVRGVRSSLTVKARPRLVYEAIRGMRDSSVKVVSENEFQAVLEERFEGLPIIGHAICRYEEKYTPFERIEYKMVQSDKFKAFEGAWALSPINNGAHTVVELSSYVDTGLAIPFARQITDAQTTKDVQKRLDEVKRTAEDKEQALASSAGQ